MARPFATHQQRDAELLKKAWEQAKRSGRKLLQKELASTWRVDESVVSQYLRGYIELNTEWKMRFALYLNCAPQEIWPDWPYKALTPGFLSPSALRIAEAWMETDKADQPAVEAVLMRMRQRRA